MTKKNMESIRDSQIETILNALQGLEYGTLQIIIHDSQITQIERTEKKRFPLKRTDPENDSFIGLNKTT